MKYLFFFNGQPLLLCCVCCKIAIQDFVKGLHKKNKKNLRFHWRLYRRPITHRYFTESCKKITGLCHNHRRVYQRTITRRYFTESCKNNYRIVPQSPTGIPMAYNPSIFHRELQTNYEIMPQSPTALPTDYNPSVFHRELQRNYGIVPQSPTGISTALPTSHTDRIPTDLRTSWSARMSDTCPSAQIPTNRKVWRDFRTFLVRISINFWRYYRRNLMPPTTINVRW
jgi:hypothetical protein